MTTIEAPADPTVSRRRRAWTWTALVATIAVLGTALAFVAVPEWRPKAPHDPESAGPQGTRALAQVLEDHGVTIEVARSLAEAERALSDDATLVIGPTPYLDDAQLEGIAGAAARTVLVEPSSRDVELFFGDAEYAGTAAGELQPVCELPEATRAGAVDLGRLFPRGTADTACYPGPDGGYGLLASDVDGTELIAIDAGSIYTNENLAAGGNAALAINLLGAHERLVWYLPGRADVAPGTAPDTLGSLTPGWVSPAIMILFATAAAAAVWRGRRFGPLVAEDLPVTVRGSETLEGRARLYQNARDPLHAAELLRRGTVARMAQRLGLQRRASADEVAAAAAARLGRQPGDVLATLHAQPATDVELVAFGERLRDLETAIDSERNHP